MAERSDNFQEMIELTFSILSTIVNSCKINGIKAYAYLNDVLLKLAIKDYQNPVELLPLNWAKNQELKVQ